VAEARRLAAEHRFFHWQIGFPNVWTDLVSSEPKGGFDAVIGNPPYVRQELLGDAVKRVLKADYAAFDGMADLYVYFYEQGLRLLRPGGRMSYVVTNKWLKAGYAEALRDLFTSRGEVQFVADFGHARHFFPDADVFPSVVVVRKPEAGAGGAARRLADLAEAPRAPETEIVDGRDKTGHDDGEPMVEVCVIARDAVPKKGLSAAVAAATYPLPRAHFTKESWTLEPPEVVALLDKIRRNGVPLAEYAGVKPYRGILTGLNEAFLIDTPTQDRLVSDDPGCAGIIKPYLRGQDIERWWSPPTSLWMIFARRGIDIEQYPSVLRHLERFRRELEPRPVGWTTSASGQEWPGRKEGHYAWYELQDAVDYWQALERPKILYGDIAWSASFAIDASGLFCSNSGYFLPTGDPWVASVLNAPMPRSGGGLPGERRSTARTKLSDTSTRSSKATRSPLRFPMCLGW